MFWHLPQVFIAMSVCPLESWFLQWEHLQQISHFKAVAALWI